MLVAVGCAGESAPAVDAPVAEVRSQDRDTFDPEGIALLDSGNVAYREDDVERALVLFERAADRMPDNAAAWFGVGMAAEAMGRDAQADSAFERASRLAPGPGANR